MSASARHVQTDSPHFGGIAQGRAEQIASIDAEVTRTNDTISELLVQRAALNRKRNALLPAVNPPPEVLSVIFEFACCPCENNGRYSTVIGTDFWQPSGSYRPNKYSEVVPGPLYLSRVCSMWRNIALSSPRLWNSIKLSVTRRHAKEQAVVLRYWLSKSGACPLSVALVEGANAEAQKWDNDMPTDSIDSLMTYSDRLLVLELSMVSTEDWMPALVHISSNSVPNLECLTLSVETRDRAFLLGPFTEATKLREVSLSGYLPAQVLLPWTQIERFVTDSVDSHDPYEAFRSCPHLLHCTLKHMRDSIVLSIPLPAPFTHTALESLELLAINETDLRVLVYSLTTPMLRSFKLQLLEERPSIPIILPFFVRSACPLETLDLYGVIMPEADDFVACLQALPRLRNLLLENPFRAGKFPQKILNLMNPKKHWGKQFGERQEVGDSGMNERDMGCLVPNLEWLYYQGSVTFEPHALVEFLTDRWNCQRVGDLEVEDENLLPENYMPATRLQTVTFKITWSRNEHPGFQEEDIEALHKLRQEGMDIRVVEYDELGLGMGIV